MDGGMLVTGLGAALAALRGKDGGMRVTLPLAWCASMVAGISFTMSWAVATFALTDLAIAVYCLIHWHQRRDQRARAVAALSMALMPAHFVMSASRGHFDWTVYAALVNAGFCLQCAVATGGLDGLGRRIARLRPRAAARISHGHGGS